MAFCGLLNAIIWNLPIVQQLLREVSPADAEWLGGLIFTVIMVVYASGAAASAFALLRLRPWAVSAYVAWCMSMGISLAWFSLHEPEGLRTASILMGLVGSAIFLVACPYIARHTRATPAPN
jgi:hypothetical protein